MPSMRWGNIVIPVLMGLVIGCGGGGGSGSGSTSTTGSQTSYTDITPFGGVPGATETSQMVNLTQLVSGDQVYLGATAMINSNGTPYTTTLVPYNYVVAGGASVATVTANGVLSVVTSTPGTYSISASSAAGKLSWTIGVTAPLNQAVVTGQVIVNPGGAGVPGATVTSYTSSGASVTSVTTASDGSFSLPVASGAVGFSVSTASTTSPPTYQQVWGYGNANRNQGSSACNPTFPTITTNHHYPLPYSIVLNIETDSAGITYPPSPPASCLVQP